MTISGRISGTRNTAISCRSAGGTELDAALLMMPLVRFVAPTDPVWLETLDAIGTHLCDDGLVYRYRNTDGLAGRGGRVHACTFWYVECLARAGRLDEAQMNFEKGLRYANTFGLFAEELDEGWRASAISRRP